MAELHNTSGPVKPQTNGPALPGGGQTGTPATAGSSNADPNSKSGLHVDGQVPNKLVKADADIYTANGYKGVDPQYQNGATANERP